MEDIEPLIKKYGIEITNDEIVDKINELINILNKKQRQLSGDEVKQSIAGGLFDKNSTMLSDRNGKIVSAMDIWKGTTIDLYANAPYKIVNTQSIGE